MQIIKKQQIEKGNHLILLHDQLDAIKKDLSQEEFEFFQKKWSDEAFQYLKTASGFIFVYNTKGESAEKIRNTAHQIHTLIHHAKEVILVATDKDLTLAFLEGFMLSNYQFLYYLKEAEKKKYKLETLYIINEISEAEILEISNLIHSVFWARDRVNEPVSHLTAPKFAEQIVKLGKTSGFDVEVLEKNKLETLKMGGILAVNKGSETPPNMSVLVYKPQQHKNNKPIVLVGKGVVYDTGGLSLKPSNFMDTMKSDMAGAACMVATIDALAKNKIPLYVIGLMPITDNRPGKEAYTPGDVVTMYDGTTVEVLNTDAEGRMILADALAYANKYEPELVIDAATLTGAAVRALGTKTSISMGNAKDKYFKKLNDAGMQTHDRVFRLPFWDEWLEEMKSDIADLKNLGGPNAGMITAGKFLEHFVKYPYIHLDIAGPAFLDTADSYHGKGGTGAGVRLLYTFLKGLN